MNPIAFSLFGNDVRWYGILIGVGMLLSIYIAYKRAHTFGIKPDRIIDVSLLIVPCAVIGARAWYVLFNWEAYKGSFSKIIAVNQGGLAFHGGFFLCLMAIIVACRVWKINIWDMMDNIAMVVPLGQAIGRWGNYINHEAHGIETSLPWAIEVDGKMVHPTFLYESIWCFLLFILLMKLAGKRRFKGQLILLYGILYSTERFFVEWLRTDSLRFMGFRTAQLVSLAAIVICGTLYCILRKKASE